VGLVCTACIAGISLVADRKFLIAPLQAHREERVGRPGWGLGKKPANVVTPPDSVGAGTSSGASGGATINRPAIDTNQAQQPGVGISAGTSGGATIKR
jgi:hypothetical protein